MIPWLMAGAGAAQIGGSIFGGLFGGSAEKRRANAIRDAGIQGADQILAASRRGVDKATAYTDMARADLSPFRDMGVEAGGSLMDMLLGGGDVSAILKASPLFNFQSELGTRNINRELAARGLYGSGAGLESLAKFNAQLTGEEGQRLTDRLFGLTQLGANTASNMADMTNRAGLSMADMIYGGGVNAANMRYNATVGAANATSLGDRMLADMGQNIFNTVGSGFKSFGEYEFYKPVMDSMANMMTSMGKSYGMGGTKAVADNDFSMVG